MNGDRLDSRWVRTVYAACRCRRGYMCGFCRSHRPRPQSRCVDGGERLTRPDSRNAGRCLEHRLYPVRQDLAPRCAVCGLPVAAGRDRHESCPEQRGEQQGPELPT